MATTINPDSAKDSGAEFEENKPSHKIEVTTRARASKPEFSGSAEPSEIDSKTPPKEPATVAAPKSSTLKPDITKEEAKPDEPEDKPADAPAEEEKSKFDEPISDDGAAIDELAKAASSKKSAKKPTDISTEDKSIQNLIDNKTYFVPVGQVTKRRNTKIFVVIILLVVAASAGAYFMMIG